MERRFWELSEQHPLIARRRLGDLSTYKLSDFLTTRKFHRLELYRDFCRLREIEDQIAFGLPGRSTVSIALSRARPSFTERDRAVLELARPHLSLAYEHIRERERHRALIDALESGLEDRHIGMIQLDPRGYVAHTTSTALELLDAYFASRGRSPRRLPEQLRAWLDGPGDGSVVHQLSVEGARGRLRVREQRHAAPGGWRILILEELRPSPPSIDAVRSLGLTDRQAQVLRLLACGKQSRQIGAELQISTATVEKHLEHIYERLGVNTRAQALAHIYGLNSA